MSKASEWARKYLAAYGAGGPPEIWVTQTNMREPSQRFLVSPMGDLEMGGWSMDSEEAIRFARWILETFGERDA